MPRQKKKDSICDHIDEIASMNSAVRNKVNAAIDALFKAQKRSLEWDRIRSEYVHHDDWQRVLKEYAELED